MEKRVGIENYVNSDIVPFEGILKHRFSDFQVNEIDLDGKVIHFDHFANEPNLFENENVNKSDDLIVVEKLGIKYDRNVFENLPPSIKDEKESIVSWFNQLDSNDFCSDVSVPFLSQDKEERRNIHAFFRENFTCVYTETFKKEEETYLRIYCQKFQKSSFKPSRTWPTNIPSFAYIPLIKCNIDTISATSLMSEMLKKKSIGTAGTKDKRAVTSQLISIRQITPERLLSAQKGFKNFKLGKPKYFNDSIRLGDLKGNQFQLVIRETDVSESDLANNIDLIKSNGFLNYFGLQRFGTKNISTHEYGLLFLKGDFEGLYNLFFTPDDSASEKFNEACELMKQKDYINAQKAFPHYCTAERAVARALSKNVGLRNAFSHIPRKLRTIYAHAFQSFIFNHMINRRWALSHDILIGDLVLNDNGEPIVIDSTNISDYSMKDVVLTLPSPETVYSPVLVEEYKSILELFGFTLDFDIALSTNEMLLTGGYRKLLMTPLDVEGSCVYYRNEDIDADLVDSDWNKLVEDSIPVETRNFKDGVYDHQAIILRFSLEPSTYATMFLREISRMKTNKQSHANISQKISSDVPSNEKKREPNL
eukprot:TRINITY_DN3459_c0_g1_i1.p1 TRINITY_DN3459_c0_g1~~TRINITY_DN3459_c0_g1_i1.p1  ORF type:complete len:592 (-),score=169.63 TRINITY_DN3459_c0_g1_i1:4-1779(-)